jgi:hypothetical protein
MRKIAIFIAILFAFSPVIAQLSTRESDPINLKFGTRPQAGNMSIYFGIGSQELKDLRDKNKDVSGLPLISLKYYLTDQLVARILLKSFSVQQTLSGDLPANVTGIRKDVTVNSEYYIVPGIEKHFSANNIFDVYIAAGIPLGFQKDAVTQNIKFSAAGDYTDDQVAKNSMIYGFEVLLGLQVYLSFLPISVGIEAGSRGIGYGKQQYKHDQTVSVAGVNTSQTFYTTGNTAGTNYTQYKQLTYSKFNLDNEFRFVISYYFRR